MNTFLLPCLLLPMLLPRPRPAFRAKLQSIGHAHGLTRRQGPQHRVPFLPSFSARDTLCRMRFHARIRPAGFLGFAFLPLWNDAYAEGAVAGWGPAVGAGGLPRFVVVVVVVVEPSGLCLHLDDPRSSALGMQSVGTRAACP